MATAASPGCSAAWSRRRTNVGLAAKARAEGAGTLRKPLLTGGCVCNVGFSIAASPDRHREAPTFGFRPVPRSRRTSALGHLCAFAPARIRVYFQAVNRHSAPRVG